MKFSNVLSALFVILLVMPFASAGTLKAGSSIQVSSNYGGLNFPQSIVGTWSSTPSVNDVLTISNANLPSGYKINQSIVVNIGAPQFSQDFRVYPNSQVPIYSAVAVQSTYATIGRSCQDAFSADLAANYNNRVLLPGVKAVAEDMVFWCTVDFVVVNQQKGYSGQVVNQGILYDQKIDVKGAGSMHLFVNGSQGTPQYVDTIPGFARATLLNFNQFTSAQLTDKNVYAFQPKNVYGPADPWTLYGDAQGLGSYQAAYDAMKNEPWAVCSGVFACSGQAIDVDQAFTDYRNYASTMSAEATRIAGLTGNAPSQWGGNYGVMSYQGNDIIVPLKLDQTALTADIQLIFNGGAFGLYIPTGVPKITSSDSSVSFIETKSALLHYSISNVGTDTGTFSISATCDDNRVISDNAVTPVSAGASVSGALTITAKASVTDAINNVKCTLNVMDTNTKASDSRSFTVSVTPKAQCVQGEQSAPQNDPSSAGQAVYTYDSQCHVIATTNCATNYGTFKQVNGLWSCVKNDGAVPPPPAPKTFQGWLFILSLVVGVVLGGFAGYYTYQIKHVLPRKLKKTALLWALIAFLVVVVAVVWGVATLSGTVVSAFSFSWLTP